MAEPDLYMLEYEQPFTWNYLKGMVGLWCWQLSRWTFHWYCGNGGNWACQLGPL